MHFAKKIKIKINAMMKKFPRSSCFEDVERNLSYIFSVSKISINIHRFRRNFRGISVITEVSCFHDASGFFLTILSIFSLYI